MSTLCKSIRETSSGIAERGTAGLRDIIIPGDAIGDGAQDSVYLRRWPEARLPESVSCDSARQCGLASEWHFPDACVTGSSQLEALTSEQQQEVQ